MSTKNTVIYHRADFDGIFCREIARKFFGNRAAYIGWDHGDPQLEFPKEGMVFVLDLSPDCFWESPLREEFVKRLVWIDHHKSAMEKFPPDIPGYRIDGVAACRLSWQWFAEYQGESRHIMPTKEMFLERLVVEPLSVRLAGEYDVWDKRDPRAEVFQHGLRSRELSAEDWDRLLTLDGLHIREEWPGCIFVAELLQNGEKLQFAKTEENAGIITSYGFDVEFEGLKFLACNHARFNSHLFAAGIKPHHQALLGFNYDGKNGQWRVSLYHAPGHEDLDLSKIAVKHGGGGHRGACGFRLSNDSMCCLLSGVVQKFVTANA